MMNESTDPPTPDGQEQPGKRQQMKDQAFKLTPNEARRLLELMLESVRRKEAREANEKPKK